MRRLLTILIGCLVALVTMAPVGAWAQFIGRNTPSATYTSGSLGYAANLRCNTINGGGVTIAWDPPSGVTASKVKYNVGRKLPGATTYTTIATNAPATTYADKPGVALGTVTYAVQAVYLSWTSAFSPGINANFLVISYSCTAAGS